MTIAPEIRPPALTHPVLCRHPVDLLGRMLMRVSSRRLVRAEHPWLIGPSAGRDVVGHEWVQRTAADLCGSTSTSPDHGLLGSFAELAGDSFDPSDVDSRIADFYEHAARWKLDLWSQWSAVAWPFGRLITALLSERLQQACLPMHSLDVSHGMSSEVVHIHDAAGNVAGAAWLRNMIKTGTVTYSGMYGVKTLPATTQPSVRVVFPLPLGSLQVFLTPSAGPNGSLYLRSPLGKFGDNGAYLVLERYDDTISVRRIPLKEVFHLYVDSAGDVRADHSLRLWSIPAVRLHYRLQRA
jgi:hypothetical protein